MSYSDIWVTGPNEEIFVRAWNYSLDSKSPIVLLHDSLGSVELWRNFPELLSEATKRPVIAYDRPGFGKSHELYAPLSADFIADESAITFQTVRNKLGIQKFIALGHSVGGAMAIHCASRYPDACEAVITLAAQSFVEDRTLQGVKSAQQLFKDPNQVDKLKKYHGDKTKWVLDAWMNTWLSEEFALWSLSTALPKVTAKLLAIHGKNDEYGSVEHPERIVNFTGGESRLMLMDNTAHFPHREHPQKVVDAIKEFLVNA